MENITEDLKQELKLVSRKHFDVNGVKEVDRFDDLCVVLKTVCGELTVEGKDLKISVLDTEQGIVSLDGRIDSIYYFDTEYKKDAKKGVFGRWFS